MIKVKGFIQLFFLGLFVTLLAKARIQLWIIIFLVTTLAAFFWGRFYCGWICPIYTITNGINWLYKKLKIERKKMPNILKTPFFRHGMVIFLVIMMVLTMRGLIKIPLLPILTVLGVFIALIFVPSFWHRYLCPYGAILNLSGKFAKFNWLINENKCIQCNICKKICPGEAILDGVNKYPVIDIGNCLSCATCAQGCPKGAIDYMKLSQIKKGNVS